MALSPQQKLAQAERAKAWLSQRLKKREARVNFCHDKKVYFNREARRLHLLGKDKAAHDAALRAAYWNELEDKAILGRNVFRKRLKRIKHKIRVLSKLVQQQDHPQDGVSVPVAPWNPYHRPIANWIIPHIWDIWNAGWRGVVTSGYRSPDDQCRACIGVCDNCGGCPGRCAAPGTSNHQRYVYPGGAIDVTNYYLFGAKARQVGAPLRNTLGSQDPVHFSEPGN